MAQARCGCNQNYYDQVAGCMKCQSSSSAHYSVKDLDGYKLVCASFGETWKEIYVPGSETATTTASAASNTATNTPLPSDGSTAGDHKTANSLSGGAVAGIVVSVIALVVALSVAGYVYRRRKRDGVRDDRVEDEYKFNDTQRDSYMEQALPQYTGMIQPTLPPIANVSNLRVMNPDNEDDDLPPHTTNHHGHQQHQPSFEVTRNASPGWRRGSFDDD
ncbi:hypothetical protein BGX28_006640 [Mortierella sp. GBA30]|nr:hypothetical protein BGX28_006640 [Mortierella sp. GBA30]